MKFETAPMTGEFMTGAIAPKTTSGAYLRSISGIHQSQLSLSFNLVSGKGKEHSPWPGVKPPVPKSRTFLSLLEIQVFKDQNTVLGSPFNQFLGGYMTEVLGAASLLTLKPFEGPSDGSGALTLCLTGRKLLLEPLDGLTGLLVLDPSFKARDKKFLTIRVNDDQGIGLVEVNSYGKDTRRIWNFNSNSNVANKLAILNLHRDAVYFLGIGQHRLEVVGDSIVKMLPAGYRPDRKRAVLPEICIPTPLTNKEQGKGALEPDRSSEFVAIVLGRYISSCNEPDGGTGKLTGELSFDRVISSFVEVKSLKRFSVIPTYWRNLVGNVNKCLKGYLEVIVWFYNYLSSTLTIHQKYITTILNKCQLFSGKKGVSKVHSPVA